ncbi:hypothetical protein, partial [Escherichia coli]|uniref:hypothetical protein n=1 Tax=Escherichia coli TaxID=562 RepID=UPI003CC97AEE
EEPAHTDGQSCSTSFRDQQVDDAGRGISGLIQTRCQTQDVIHRFRAERWLCANHPERTSADTDQYHHPGSAGLTGAAYDNMKTLMERAETHLDGEKPPDFLPYSPFIIQVAGASSSRITACVRRQP